MSAYAWKAIRDFKMTLFPKGNTVYRKTYDWAGLAHREVPPGGFGPDHCEQVFLPDRSRANIRCIVYREVKETLETCDRSQNVESNWTANWTLEREPLRKLSLET